MKKLLYTLFAALMLVACSNSGTDDGGSNNSGGNQNNQPEITLNVTTSNFATDGGSNIISFTTPVAWTAEIINMRADAWCKVEPLSGGAGTAYITVTTTPNDTPDDRSASIVIKAGTVSKTITVSQKQKDALTVTASKFEVGNNGGEVAIEVNANIEFSYAIEDASKEWITYNSTRAMQSSTLVFDVAKNEKVKKREGKVVISSGAFQETITIYQDGETPSIVLSQNTFSVSAEESTIAVEVKSNVDVEVELPKDADWIMENTTRAMSTNTYRFDIMRNDGYDSREAKIKFTNKENNISEEVTVNQMQCDAIVVADSEYQFGYEGGELDFDILTNVDDISVAISDNAQEWIKQVATRAMETKSLHFDIAACESEEYREGTITISGGNATQTIVVKQCLLDDILKKEREALIAFYKATDGDNWSFNNKNWCSDKPVSEWYGVTTNSSGLVNGLLFKCNNLNGEIPKEIADLSHLEKLYLYGPNSLGSIPKELGELTHLKSLTICNSNLTGSIPAELGQLSNLEYIDLTSNNLSGSIPAELGQLSNLKVMWLHSNDLTGSIPAEFGQLASLEEMWLGWNELSGAIPSELAQLKNLTELQLSGNKLSGQIPAELGQMSKLKSLSLVNNKLSGSIPVELGNLTNLEQLSLMINELTGSIPAELGKLTNLERFDLAYNYLTGTIPQSITDLDCWVRSWNDVIYQYPYMGETLSLEGVRIPAPKFSETTIDGQTVTDAIYSENELTVLFTFADWCPGSHEFAPKLLNIYNHYKDKGLEVLCIEDESDITPERIAAFRDKYQLPWHCFSIDPGSDLGVLNSTSARDASSGIAVYPAINVVDKNGNIVFNFILDSSCDLEYFIAEKLGDSGPYESTDYSKNGEVVTLQTATEGNGIDIVLMGDAYTDRQIADGTYDKHMKTMYENLFSEEPYKSFKNLFNVYYVNVVSKHEGYATDNTTALGGYFGNGTLVGGNDQSVFAYGEKALASSARLNETLFIVAMNSDNYAGTCYMYYTTTSGNYSSGPSIAYCPRGGDAETFAQLIHHEAGGHGFAKLADEYTDSMTGAISAAEVQEHKSQQNSWGWWKNVDFTGDRTAVRWNYFLSDPRYANDGLGVYEGALTYMSGVWRSTVNSIMRYNTDGYNAPSREAIYYRIHKLAYGADWEYDYEKFVEWDDRNHKTAASATSAPYRGKEPKQYKPTHPPVVIKQMWNDAK